MGSAPAAVVPVAFVAALTEVVLVVVVVVAVVLVFVVVVSSLEQPRQRQRWLQGIFAL